ncbi:MAG TPA: ABC transporter substrate-binding protein [Bacillales bacterium]|nr:ABC transporter substrate-binding protein [Bacillales bacterium]
MKLTKWQSISKMIITVLIPVLLLAACGTGGGSNSGGGNEKAAGNGNGTDTHSQKIVFADAGWGSIRFHNWVARTIIEEGYGFPTGVTQGSSPVTILGLQNGDIDVYMEIWTQNVEEPWQKALKSGKVKQVSVNYDDNKQGLYVPTYVIEGDSERGIQPMAPYLKTTKDLLKYADLFEGRIVGAPLGWSVESVCKQQMEKYGLKGKYEYFSPGSGTSLKASLKRAYEDGKPWVGYMWGPTWILGKYDMTLLEGSFPQNDVLVAIHKKLSDQAPKVVKFLSQYETSAALTNAALAYMHKNEASPEEAAKWFLRNHEELWMKWVPKNIAQKVKTAIQK